jgi:hypothetical protein
MPKALVRRRLRLRLVLLLLLLLLLLLRLLELFCTQLYAPANGSAGIPGNNSMPPCTWSIG